MSRFVKTLALVLALSLPCLAGGAPAKWATPAAVTNPAAGAAVADSGVLLPSDFGFPSACPNGGHYWVFANITSSVAGLFKVIVFDGATPTPNAVSTIFFGLSGQGSAQFAPPMTIPVPSGGKIQIQSNGALVGTAQAALSWSFWGCI